MMRYKRELHLETKQQRVVVRAWGCRVSPVRTLEVFAATSKVEAAYKRSGWLQGTLVVCFQREGNALAAFEGLAQHTWGRGACCGSVQHEPQDGEL